MEEKLNQKLKLENKTFINLEEIEERLGKNISYLEFVETIKHFTNDGILKPVRKEQK